MLRGHTYSEQVFANKVFRLFIDTFLNKNSGIIQGCSLSNTTNSVTVGQGYLCIRGGFIEVVGDETIEVNASDAYCKLICELDLSKENTESDFEQVKFKVITGATAYPNLTQEDVFNSGNIYQIELAQFKTSVAGISDFKDIRTFLEFESIYNKIENDTSVLIQDLQNAITGVEDGSAFMLSSKIKDGSEVPTAEDLTEGQIYLQWFEE